MNIAVCIKLTPDPEDIEVQRDGAISLSRAEWVIGNFDLQALEAGVRLAEATSGKVTVISAGSQQINQSRLKKDILSRGAAELYMVIDDSLAQADTYQTACVLSAAVQKSGPYDLILCGEGSADLYFQQTGMQLGELLELPVLNFISKIDSQDGKLIIERTLENEIEILEVPMPAVLSVTTDINPARLPTMKDILKAGQKPIHTASLADLGLTNLPARSTEPSELKAPERAQRKQIILDKPVNESVNELVEYLKKDGLLPS